MKFKQFNEKLMKHVEEISKDEQYLFTVDLDLDTLWDTYLDSFPPGTNEIFRERREYDCSCCKHFIRSFGNVVSLKDNNVVTIWDFQANDNKFQIVIDSLASLVRSKQVDNVFVPFCRSFGTLSSKEITKDGSVHIWSHFYSKVSDTIKIFNESDVGSVRGQLRDIRNVLQRSLEEISPDSIDTVLDLIAQNSLYKGEEWASPLKQFYQIQGEYKTISDEDMRDHYCWTTSLKVGAAISKIKNHSIGVLLNDITSGMDLNEAVKRYEKIVAPINYKRPKAIFTKKMVEDAQSTVKGLGLDKSLGRRFANIDDITVNNILFANKDTTKRLAGDVFSELAESVPEKQKNFDKVEDVTIENFINNILPKAEELEILLDNSHKGNMVSLIAPQDLNSKSMFKWNNGFSWAYSGNITDSMKDRVKSAGGNVEGVLRFSIQWNEDNDNPDDLDAHCIEPNGNHIEFPNKGRIHPSSGKLDVDIIDPAGKVAVENITWTNLNKMQKGLYRLFVHNYSSRGARSGFTAEVEFNNQIYSFSYSKPLKNNNVVEVADIEFDGENFKITEKIPSHLATKEIWGLTTNKFYPVSICMYSPNYWDGQSGIGHRHYFFMVNNCKNGECPNGFFNEFLDEGLMKHKRVFEALGSKMKVTDTDKQLSGIGFSSTKRASLICKVKGSFNRVIKINF